ncbi:MAG TPA: hypothetical protein VGE74_11250, partial [Gemmata sp.]
APGGASEVPVSAVAARPAPPALTPEAELDHTLKLPPGVSPLRPVAGAVGAPKRLFAAGPGQLIAVPLNQGAETAHAAPELFTQAAEMRDGFVAVGPRAVALYGAGREPVWVFRMPVTARLTGAPRSLPPRADEPSLSSFRLAGPWLLARLGEFHLIALDLGARRVAWVLAATGGNGYEPLLFAATPRFGPHFAVAETFVVAQLSDGRRWFVRLDTGRPAPQPGLGEATARVDWPHAPLELGAGHLALADGAGRVRLVALGGIGSAPPVAVPVPGFGGTRVVRLGGGVRWQFEVDRPDGLTGEPPQVRAFGDLLLVAVRRNHGVEIEGVDPGTGKRVWNEAAFVDADRIDLSAGAADAEHVYVPAGNALLGFARKDGKPVWGARLPDAHGTGWVVRAGAAGLVVHPTQALAREAPGTVRARLTNSFRREPQLWRLPGLALTLYDAWVDRAAPVLLFDPGTGKRVGKFDIPGRGPALAAWFGPGATVFATGDRVVWLK